MKFIAPAGRERSGGIRNTNQKGIQNWISASCAGKDQVLIEWSHEQPRVGSPEDSVGFLHIICNPDTWLRFTVGNKAVVQIAAHAEIKCPIAGADCVLYIHGKQLYVSTAPEWKQVAA